MCIIYMVLSTVCLISSRDNLPRGLTNYSYVVGISHFTIVTVETASMNTLVNGEGAIRKGSGNQYQVARLS